MITAKIFKVKEATQYDGDKYYHVLGYDNKLFYLLGWYSFYGSKENETFMEAMEQIDSLIDYRIVSDKTIHVVFPDKKNKPTKQKEKVKTQ